MRKEADLLSNCEKGCRLTRKKAVAFFLMFLLLFFLVSLLFTAVFPGILFGRRDRIPPTEMRFEDTTLASREEAAFDSGGNLLRGWIYGLPGSCRSANRSSEYPFNAYDYLGFRLSWILSE